MKKLSGMFSAGLGLLLALSLLPGARPRLKAENKAPKLHIAAVYGGAVSEKGKKAKKTAVSNSFIEIYNPNDEAVSLAGYRLHYQGFPTQEKERREGEYWASLALDPAAVLPARSSFLINAGETAAAADALQLKHFDQVWEDAPAFVTKGAKYLLTYQTDKVPAALVNPFDTDGAGSKIAGYIDMLGTAGNDVGENDQIDGSEGAYPGGENGSSKQKGFVRMDRNKDSDVNLADFRMVDFREETDPAFLPRSLADGPLPAETLVTSAASESAVPTGSAAATLTTAASETSSAAEISSQTEETGTQPTETSAAASTATETPASETEVPDTSEETGEASRDFPIGGTLRLRASYSVGSANEDGGVAEIVKYNSDNQKMYVVSGALQCVDIVDLSRVESGAATLDRRIDVAEMGRANGFVPGDITSVAVNTKLDLVAISVQHSDYRQAGSIVFLDYDGNYLQHVPAGVQPDMITFSPDGRWLLTADEGEPREGYGQTDPAGSVTAVDLGGLKDGTEVTKLQAADVRHLGFAFMDQAENRVSSPEAAILHKPGSPAAADAEPEYIAFSPDSRRAFVSLQENNAIAVLNMDSLRFEKAYGLAFKDHSRPENALDLNKDGKINIQPEDVLGVPMPDGIAAAEIDGRLYVLTANEGDAREWGDFENIGSKKINGSKKKVEYLLPEYNAGLDPELTYLLGTRSFAIYDAQNGMRQVADSGSDFERITAQHFPTIFNANHKNNKIEGRSNKKGPEPEDVKVLAHKGRHYAFISLERIGGVMMYDISTPAAPEFTDYINLRDPNVNGLGAGHLGAEGLDTVEASLSPNRRPMILVANEVSGTVMILDFDEPLPEEKPTETTQPEVTTTATEATQPKATTTAAETTQPEASTTATVATQPEVSTTTTEATQPEVTTTAAEAARTETSAAAGKSTQPQATTAAAASASAAAAVTTQPGPGPAAATTTPEVSKTGEAAVGGLGAVVLALGLATAARIVLKRRQKNN